MAKSPDLQAQRRANLRRIVDDMGGSPSSLAKLMSLSGPSFISQLLSGNRSISDKTARRIEDVTSRPMYWMDHDHTSDSPARVVDTDPSYIGAAVKAVVQTQQKLNTQITPDKYAEIVDLVYIRAQELGVIDQAYAERLVKLTM